LKRVVSEFTLARMKTLTTVVTLLFCALMLSVSAEASHNPTASLLDAQRRLTRAMANDGPVDGFVPYIASDIAYLHPQQEIITGRDATRTFLRTVYPRGTQVKTVLHVLAGQASADATVGFTFGWFEEVTSPQSASPSTAYGRFIATWKRRDNGWSVHAFARLASTTPLAPPPEDALIIDGVPADTSPGTPESHALDVAIADSQFADLSVAQGYTVAFPAWCSDAAVVVTAGALYYNRAGVEFAWSGWTPDQSLAWHPLRAEAARSGDLGWSIGHGTFSVNDGTNVQRSYSKYLTIWIHTPEGWRWLMDGGNGRPAPPPPPTP
jgi:ketosteroid isomerase-like protein